MMNMVQQSTLTVGITSMKLSSLVVCLLIVLCGCTSKINPAKISLVEYYDSQYNVVKTDVYYDDKLKDTVKLDNPNDEVLNATYILGENGKQISVSVENGTSCEYSWTGDIISYSKCNIKGIDTITVDSKIEDEKLVELYEDVNTANPYKTMYSYDDNGKLIKSESGYGEGENFILSDYQVYEYDDEKTIIYHNSLEEGKDSYIYYRYVDDEGRTLKLERYDLNNKLLYVEEYSFYDNGIMKSSKYSDGEGNVSREIVYNEYGAITKYVNGDISYKAE